jgi:hypothetical protein
MTRLLSLMRSAKSKPREAQVCGTVIAGPEGGIIDVGVDFDARRDRRYMPLHLFLKFEGSEEPHETSVDYFFECQSSGMQSTSTVTIELLQDAVGIGHKVGARR